MRTMACPSATYDDNAGHGTGAVSPSALAFPFLAPEGDRETARDRQSETGRKFREEGQEGGK